MRGFLLLLNILFVLIGLTMVGLGIYLLVDKNISAVLNRFKDDSDFKGQSLGFLAFVMIGGGIFTAIISFVGCLGKNNAEEI